MYVYILKCNDNSYYTGVTNNIERRLAEHESGYNETCYTYKRRPVQLVFFETFPTPMSAIRFEKQVKRWTRAKKEALIERNWQRLHELAKCLNNTTHENYRSPFDSAQGDKGDSAQGDPSS
ncbi:MAG: GIY-YIG nuclease family protein [Tenuifilaceae bacterium]|jgi:putative endonuclease|nr:GIY-YIG nuclease family protein [Tenuifilaceae bacterium]